MSRKTRVTQARQASMGGRRTSWALRLLGALALLAVALLAAYAGIRGLAHGAGLAAFQSAQLEGIPLEINHQGVVSVNGKKFTGTGDFRFALVDPDTDTNLWTNDGSHIGDSGMPTAAVAIEVEKGDYSVRLGNTGLPNMVEIPTSVFEDDNVVLRIWFDDRKHGVEQLTPDHVLTSAPYAYRAADATRADHAGAADHATTADHATEAAHATTADSATEADHAATADTAATANHAAMADDSAHATEADHAAAADEADHAAEADHATTATTADKLKKPELPPGVIVMWSGAIADIPEGWALCDGNNGTPNLTSRFVRSVPDAGTNPGSTGGSPTHAHAGGSYTAASHTHHYSGTTSTVGWWVRREGDQWDSGSTGTHSHSYSGTTDPGGGGSVSGTSAQASNLPPYYDVAFIMKL